MTIRPLDLPALQYRTWFKTLFRMNELHDLRCHGFPANDTDGPRAA